MLKDQAGGTDGYLYDSYIVPERKVHSGTILDCAPVKSALPFHICENLTGQGLQILD